MTISPVNRIKTFTLAVVLSLFSSFYWLPTRLMAQQQGATQLQLSTPAPPPVSSVSATFTGTRPAGTIIYYWVIANFPPGSAVPAGPAIAYNTPGMVNLSASQPVFVSWAGVTGATSYTVVRSEQGAFPANPTCSNCAIAVNTTSTIATDTNSGLASYTASGAVAATATMTLDNITSSFPYVNLQIFGSIFKVAAISGSVTAGNCVKFGTVLGTIIDSGSTCGGGGSGNVTAIGTLTAGLPLLGLGSTLTAVGTRQGSTTKYVSYNGSAPATDDCAKFDSSGNLTTSGAGCGGGGSSAFSSITAGTNNSGQAMIVGSTSSLTRTGNGIIDANKILTVTITSLSGNTGVLATASGTLTNGNVAGFDGNGNVVDGAVAITNIVTLAGTQILTNKTLSGNTISATGWTNMNHAHAAANSGGQLDNTAVKTANLQGNGTKFQMAGTNSGVTGSALCNDANGNTTTTSCTPAAQAYQPYGITVPFTAPDNSLYSWVNQGSATVQQTTNPGPILLFSPSGGFIVRIKPYPAVPFTDTQQFILDGVGVTAFSQGGLVVAATGANPAMYVFAAGDTTSKTLRVYTATSATDASPTVVAVQALNTLPPKWLRVADNNTNLIFSYSYDGTNFTTLYTIARTTFLTPAQIGFAISALTTVPTWLTLVSDEVH